MIVPFQKPRSPKVLLMVTNVAIQDMPYRNLDDPLVTDEQVGSLFSKLKLRLKKGLPSDLDESLVAHMSAKIACLIKHVNTAKDVNANLWRRPVRSGFSYPR